MPTLGEPIPEETRTPEEIAEEIAAGAFWGGRDKDEVQVDVATALRDAYNRGALAGMRLATHR